jgi:hypothetical protein
MILIIACFCILATGIPAVTGIFLTVINLFGTGLAIGFAFELIALLVSLPALVFYRNSP